VREQIEKELAIIDELDCGGYFLTMHEIVGFCRSKDILCQGRGSAGNRLPTRISGEAVPGFQL
jgi:error-prone DNA polymerase